MDIETLQEWRCPPSVITWSCSKLTVVCRICSITHSALYLKLLVFRQEAALRLCNIYRMKFEIFYSVFVLRKARCLRLRWVKPGVSRLGWIQYLIVFRHHCLINAEVSVLQLACINVTSLPWSAVQDVNRVVVFLIFHRRCYKFVANIWCSRLFRTFVKRCEVEIQWIMHLVVCINR